MFSDLKNVPNHREPLVSQAMYPFEECFDNASLLNYPPGLVSADVDPATEIFLGHNFDSRLEGMLLVGRSSIDEPRIVVAPSPWNRESDVRLILNKATINGYIDDGCHAKVGEYMGLVHGECEEIVADTKKKGGSGGLSKSIALFRGVNRPRIDLGLDKKIYAYITNPGWTYIYPNKFSGAPTRDEKPLRAVFVTYVEMLTTEELEDLDYLPTEERAKLSGIVHDWEWVLCDSNQRQFPEDFENRYDERTW